MALQHVLARRLRVIAVVMPMSGVLRMLIALRWGKHHVESRLQSELSAGRLPLHLVGTRVAATPGVLRDLTVAVTGQVADEGALRSGTVPLRTATTGLQKSPAGRTASHGTDAVQVAGKAQSDRRSLLGAQGAPAMRL